MNKGNERIMAIIIALRKLPRWALISITLGVIVILAIAMVLLIPQSSPSTGDASYLTSTGYAFGVFLKLGIVVIIIAGLAFVVHRMQLKGHTETSKRVGILETVHLTAHRTLYLISIENQKILIGATDQSMTTLCRLSSSDNSDEDKQSIESSQGFSDFLEDAKNKIAE